MKTIATQAQLADCAGPGTTGSPEQQMNNSCFCVSLDQGELRSALSSELRSDNMMALLEERCPSLFSSMPVFISPVQRSRMEQAVRAIESVIAMPAYRERVLAHADPIARHAQGPASVFFGYDFHINGDQVGLIEINTNAGGAMLNALMARAHRACSVNAGQLAGAAASGPAFEQEIVAMFRREWSLAGKERPLRSLAIVDNDPANQYLYPEFILFQRLFARSGMHAVIAAPHELVLRDGAVWHGETMIDLVYNRLTDFMFAEAGNAHLRAAYLTDAAVFTPHPQAHALYADKKNLALLSDRRTLSELGVPEAVQNVLLDTVLPTRIVNPSDADLLWRERKSLFFKPTAGFGGRAAYRGDKVTTRVWEQIIAGGYVAQALMVPGARVTGSKDNPQTLKFDVRLYAYEGQTQWTAARLYQGQTTNFRTPGGGFAPVYSLPPDTAACSGTC